MALLGFLILTRRNHLFRLFLVTIVVLMSGYSAVGTVSAVGGDLIWIQTSNPSDQSDLAYAVAVDGSGIYVVGYDYPPSIPQFEWRIEKRNLANGSLVWVQTSDPSSGNDGAYDVAVDSSGIYVVGTDTSPGPGSGNSQWRIEKRKLTDGSLIWNQTNNPSPISDSALGVAVDSSGVYIVGSDNSPGLADYQWRIEKRNLADGSLIWSQTSDPSTSADSAYDVAVDATGAYVVGYDNAAGNHEWRIEKRNLTDGSLLWSQTSNPTAGFNVAEAVAVDGSGVYVVGYETPAGSSDHMWRMEQRDLTTGTLIWQQTNNPSGGRDYAHAVAVDISGIYVAGTDKPTSEAESEWRIEKRSRADGTLIPSFGAGGVIQEDISGGDDSAYGTAVDSTGIYIVGYDNAPGKHEWRIEKRDPGRPVTKLVITAFPSSVTAGSWTTKYTVQRRDHYNNNVTSETLDVDLASTSNGTAKKFAETSGGTPVASVTIPEGSSTKDFYYYDDKAGTWTITVSAAGLTGDSKSLTVSPRSGCIIATAAYGSEMAPEVAYMRHVRDDMIGSNGLGRLLVDGWNSFYYLWSPPIARCVASSEVLRASSRILLLPLAAVVHSTDYAYTGAATIDSTLASAIAFASAAIASTVIYIMIPLLVFQSIRKRLSKTRGTTHFPKKT